MTTPTASAYLHKTGNDDTDTARFRRHRQLKNLSAVDAESMQPSGFRDVPQTDAEVHGSRDKVRRIEPRTLVVWVKEARDATTVTGEHLVRQHVHCSPPQTTRILRFLPNFQKTRPAPRTDPTTRAGALIRPLWKIPASNPVNSI